MLYRRAARDRARQSRALLNRPEVATLLVGSAAVPILPFALLLPPPLVLPALGTTAFALAAATAAYAWLRRTPLGGPRITSWDVAGACAFIGFAAGILSTPEHVLQLFGHAMTAP